MNVIMVWGPSRTKAGMNPLKKPPGPLTAMSLPTAIRPWEREGERVLLGGQGKGQSNCSNNNSGSWC